MKQFLRARPKRYFKLKLGRRAFSSTKLSSDIFNVPNTITMIRIAATPAISYLILTDQYLASIGCFWVAGFLDWLDGYFARKLNQKSIFGSFLDPLADKLFVGTTLGTLCYQQLIPWQLGALIIGRDVALVGGSFVVRYFTKPKDVGFFDMGTTAGVLSVEPTMISKVNTLAQFGLLWFTLTAHCPEIGLPDPKYLPILWYAVGGSTFVTGADYLMKGNHRNIFPTKK